MLKNKKEKETKIEIQIKEPDPKFLFSSILGGPLVSWFFHRKAFTGKYGFFLPIFLVCILCNIILYFIESFLLLHLIFNIIQCLIIGFYSATRLKLAMLNYDEKTYKNNEKNAIIVGIIITIIILVFNFLSK
jgi:hypothetical protein